MSDMQPQPGELDRVQDAILAADTAKELVEIAIGYAGLIDAELGHRFTVGTALIARAAEIDGQLYTGGAS